MKVSTSSILGTLLLAVAVAVGGCGGPGASGSITDPASAGAPNVAAPILGESSPEQFCAAANQLNQAFQRGPINPESVARYLATAWTELVPVAPAEIKSDVRRLADLAREDAALPLAERGRMSRVTAEAGRVLEYTAKHCAAEVGPRPPG